MNKFLINFFILLLLGSALQAQQKVSPKNETGAAITSLSHKGGNFRIYASTSFANAVEKFSGGASSSFSIGARRIAIGAEFGIGFTDKDLMLLVFEYYYGKYSNKQSLNLTNLGIGYKHYFLPSDFFLALRMNLSFDDNPTIKTDPGYGLNFSFGKDVHVTNRFSMGVSLFAEADAFKVTKSPSVAVTSYTDALFTVAGLSFSFILGPKGPPGKLN
jgi:hypothetical protein